MGSSASNFAKRCEEDDDDHRVADGGLDSFPRLHVQREVLRDLLERSLELTGVLSDVDERDEERAEDVGALPEAVGHRHASREVAPDLLELVAQDRIGDGVREAAYGAEERDAGLRKGVHLPAEHHEILDLHVMHEMQIAEEPAPGALLLHRLLGEAHRHDAARAL